MNSRRKLSLEYTLKSSCDHFGDFLRKIPILFTFYIFIFNKSISQRSEIYFRWIWNISLNIRLIYNKIIWLDFEIFSGSHGICLLFKSVWMNGLKAVPLNVRYLVYWTKHYWTCWDDLFWWISNHYVAMRRFSSDKYIMPN